MQCEAISSELLKVDALGRVRVSAWRREALLDAFESCGVSGAEFAAHIGVKYQTFATWRQQRNRQRQSGTPVACNALIAPAPRTEVQWLEAVLENSGSVATGKTSDTIEADCLLSIALPGGARMEIGNTAQVKLAAELLRALYAGGDAVC